MQKHHVVVALGILLSILCLTYFFYSVKNWSNLGRALETAHYFYLIPSVTLGILVYIVRAWRWQYLIRPLKHISLWSAFSITAIAFMANCTLPGRVGELIRPGILRVKEGIRYSSGLATVVVERILDLLTLVVMLVFVFIVVIPTAPGAQDMPILADLRFWGAIFAVATFAGAVFLILLRATPNLALGIMRFFLKPFPETWQTKLIGIVEHFVHGLDILASPSQVVIVCAQSILLWVLIAASMWTLTFAFPDIRLPFAGAFFVMVCVALAVALPQAPGFIGVFHVATDKALTLYKVASGSSKGYAILLWAVSILPVIVVGLACLWIEGMSMKQIRELSKEVEETERERTDEKTLLN